MTEQPYAFLTWLLSGWHWLPASVLIWLVGYFAWSIVDRVVPKVSLDISFPTRPRKDPES